MKCLNLVLLISLSPAWALAQGSGAAAVAPSPSISTKDKKSKDYVSLATVTLQEAVDAALAKVPGKAVEAELDSEKGFLVYEVKVVTSENMTHEVTVDAGNKRILKDEQKKSLFK